jgi:hypothetical protein
MTYNHQAYTRYLTLYLIVLLILGSPLLVNYLFLKRSGELLKPEQIYELQNKSAENEVIYGSSIFDTFTNIKLYAYAQKKPKIVAFGTSRTLQFRQSFFKEPFYNLGYLVAGLKIPEALHIAPKFLEMHTPDIVILGVEFWWFNQAISPLNYNQHFSVQNNAIDPAHLIKPFAWIKEGKLGLRDYASILLNKKTEHLGLKGKLKVSGIGADGSAYYSDRLTIPSEEIDAVNFNNVRKQIASGDSAFGYGDTASDSHFNKFLELIQLFESKGVKVVLFLTPLPPALNQDMKLHNYAYINDFKAKFAKAGLKLHDYLDTTKAIATTDCEFVDGTHGGDVLHARILYNIALNEPVIAPYVNLDYLQTASKDNFGLAMIPNHKITTKPEIDFLQMQCKKN